MSGDTIVPKEKKERKEKKHAKDQAAGEPTETRQFLYQSWSRQPLYLSCLLCHSANVEAEKKSKKKSKKSKSSDETVAEDAMAVDSAGMSSTETNQFIIMFTPWPEPSEEKPAPEESDKKKKRKREEQEKEVAEPSTSESKKEKKDKKKRRKEEASASTSAESSSAPSKIASPAPKSAPKAVASAADAAAFLEKHAITITTPDGIAPVVPIIDFAQLDVPAELSSTFKGFKEPTPIQACTWPPALEGRDVVGIAETGRSVANLPLTTSC